MDFFKFPSTPHLAALPGVDIRSDKVLNETERDAFLAHDIIVEEKIDGANLGISFDSEGNVRFQNRGSYLQTGEQGQWKKLHEWITPRRDDLALTLNERYILFGEWCYACHSVFYNHLPDWFLGFDIFDKDAQQFLSTPQRDAMIHSMGLSLVPRVAQGRFTFKQLHALLAQSKYSDEMGEGLYLRYDDGDWLGARAKLVRPAFVQAVDQHWSARAIQPNQVDYNR